MTRRIFVMPQRAGMQLAHPIDGLLEDAGSEWTMDQFTALLLRDGAIIEKTGNVGSSGSQQHSNGPDADFDRNETSDRR